MKQLKVICALILSTSIVISSKLFAETKKGKESKAAKRVCLRRQIQEDWTDYTSLSSRNKTVIVQAEAEYSAQHARAEAELRTETEFDAWCDLLEEKTAAVFAQIETDVLAQTEAESEHVQSDTEHPNTQQPATLCTHHDSEEEEPLSIYGKSQKAAWRRHHNVIHTRKTLHKDVPSVKRELHKFCKLRQFSKKDQRKRSQLIRMLYAQPALITESAQDNKQAPTVTLPPVCKPKTSKKDRPIKRDPQRSLRGKQLRKGPVQYQHRAKKPVRSKQPETLPQTATIASTAMIISLAHLSCTGYPRIAY